MSRIDPPTPDPLREASRGTICVCGLAKSYHPRLAPDGHEYEPRYPARRAALPSLREALPYIRHRATCSLNAVRDNPPEDEACSCGLREFWVAAFSGGER